MSVNTIIILLLIFCSSAQQSFCQTFDIVPVFSKSSGIIPFVNQVNDSTKVIIVAGYRSITSLKHVAQQFPGKHLFIDLWATWCEPCLKDMPTSDSMQKELDESGVQLVYISLDKDTDDAQWKKMIGERRIYGAHIRATKQLQDEITTLVWSGIDVYSIPHYLLISKDGTIWNKNAPAPKNRELFKAEIINLHRHATVN